MNISILLALFEIDLCFEIYKICYKNRIVNRAALRYTLVVSEKNAFQKGETDEIFAKSRAQV